jgi:Astacin (Peptidase family M12A)
MAVIKKDLEKWPSGPIGYVIESTGNLTNDWVTIGIQRFNAAVGRDVFIPAQSGQTAQVRFVYSQHGESDIGFTGKTPQAVHYHESVTPGAEYKTLHHEMGHCVGLGHEQFHSGYPLRGDLMKDLGGSDYMEEINTLQGLSGRDWVDFHGYDAESIMLYALEKMLADGRVEVTETVARYNCVLDPNQPKSTAKRKRTTSDLGARRAATGFLNPKIQVHPTLAGRTTQLSAGDVAAINELVPPTT